MSKKKIISLSVICLTTLLLVVVLPVQPAKAQFVLAWTYDSEAGTFDYDEYGQGFYMYTLQANMTESGDYPDFDVQYPNYPSTYYFNQSSYLIEGTVGYALGIWFFVWMNSTLTGATDLTDGQDYIRVNATISAFGVELDAYEDITPFYQSSFWDAEMWLYGFKANFNVLPEEGMTYTITLTYEVYW